MKALSNLNAVNPFLFTGIKMQTSASERYPIEQESLELSVFGSADGAAWEAKPIITFPQKFYCGQSPFLLDLTAHPDVKFVRAHWEVARWGRGTEIPMFEFGVSMREVPAYILQAARAEAKTLA